MKTRKILAEKRTYDPNDLTSAGGDFTLYADGRITMVTRSRWQGSRDGERWIFDGAIDTGQINPGDDNDAEALLVDWIEQYNACYGPESIGGRKTRMGRLVQ